MQSKALTNNANQATTAEHISPGDSVLGDSGSSLSSGVGGAARSSAVAEQSFKISERARFFGLALAGFGDPFAFALDLGALFIAFMAFIAEGGDPDMDAVEPLTTQCIVLELTASKTHI